MVGYPIRGRESRNKQTINWKEMIINDNSNISNNQSYYLELGGRCFGRVHCNYVAVYTG